MMGLIIYRGGVMLNRKISLFVLTLGVIGLAGCGTPTTSEFDAATNPAGLNVEDNFAITTTTTTTTTTNASDENLGDGSSAGIK